MEVVKDKNSRSGIIGTILVHLLLLFLFVSFGMPYQDPPPPNEGAMVINFGASGGGFPSEDNPEENESSSSSSNNETQNSSNSSSQENALTTENETIDLNASQNNNTPTQPEVSDNLLDALNANANANNNNNNNNNNSNDNNNSNNNNNSNSNSNGPNTGPTSGVSFSLGGRGHLSLPKAENPIQEDGKVVVDIIVDRNGKVLKAKAGARGSTTTNPILQKKAEEAAYKANFKKDPNAPFEQKGTMTFVFILN